MTDYKKFMFDNNDFSAAAMNTVVITYSEEEYLSAKNQSFLQGKEEGIKETRQQQEEKITQLLQKALSSIDALTQAENRREIEKFIEASKLSLLIIKKLLPELAIKYSLVEVENTIIDSIKSRKDEPRINIFVNEQHLEIIRKRVHEDLSQNNLTTQININSDPAISVTDCRVEWAEGNSERVFEDLLKQIETAINNAITGLEIKRDNT